MSVIAHVYQKTRGLDDDTPAGNHERDVQTSSRLRPVPERVNDMEHYGLSNSLALQRREQREMQNQKSNVANLLEAQWARGKALPRGNRGTPWKKAPNDCDHPPTAIQKGGNAVMYNERCEMSVNRWQRIPLTMVARDPETKLNNRTVLTSTGKRPVEIERPFCPHGHGSVMMQATPQQSLYWECSTCSTTPGLSLDGCDLRLVDRVSFEGADANMVPTGDDETPCL